jgi:hypothetical protein
MRAGSSSNSERMTAAMVPATTNIVSLGQLEEAGYKIVLHGGFLKLWDGIGTLVAKVRWASNCLYMLHLDVA